MRSRAGPAGRLPVRWLGPWTAGGCCRCMPAARCRYIPPPSPRRVPARQPVGSGRGGLLRVEAPAGDAARVRKSAQYFCATLLHGIFATSSRASRNSWSVSVGMCWRSSLYASTDNAFMLPHMLVIARSVGSPSWAYAICRKFLLKVSTSTLTVAVLRCNSANLLAVGPHSSCSMPPGRWGVAGGVLKSAAAAPPPLLELDDNIRVVSL